MNNTKFLYSFLVTFALIHLGAAFYPHLYQLCCQDSYSPWRGHNYYHHFRHVSSYRWPESTYRTPHYFFKPPLSYYYYDPCRSYRQNCHITQFHKCCYDCCGKLICTIDYNYVFTTTLKTTSKAAEETTIIEVTTIPTEENTTPEVITIITTEEVTTVENTTPEVTTQTTEEITENTTPEVTSQTTENTTPEVTTQTTENTTPEVTTQTTEEITTNTIPVATTIKEEITTIIIGPGSGDGPSGDGPSGDGPSGDGPSGDGENDSDNELPEIQRRNLIWDDTDDDDFDFYDDYNMNNNNIVFTFK